MIYRILESYFAILLPVGISAALILIVGLYFILRPRPKSLSSPQFDATSVKQDLAKNAASFETRQNIFPLQQARERANEKKQISTSSKQPSSLTVTSNDISAIAGDDVLSTQLDLGRAYIETGRKHLAKKILEHVAEQGSDVQQTEARKLLGLI